MKKLEEAVIEAAKQLPPKLRKRLADELRNGMEPALSQAWLDEIDRRIADSDAGKSKSYPIEDALRALDAKLARHRKK